MATRYVDRPDFWVDVELQVLYSRSFWVCAVSLRIVFRVLCPGGLVTVGILRFSIEGSSCWLEDV